MTCSSWSTPDKACDWAFLQRAWRVQTWMRPVACGAAPSVRGCQGASKADSDRSYIGMPSFFGIPMSFILPV